MATQNVNIVFRTIGGNQLNSQLRNLSQNSSGVTQALARMQGHLGSIAGGFGLLRVAATAVLGGIMVGELVKVGDEFERTTIQMAGFLQAMHLAPSYAAGLTAASDVMRKIRRDAAVLPGEAEDYARVFTVALPEVSQAIGGSIDEMMKFTNKATAIGTVFGIDSFQLAHDLQRMMYAGRGSAGFHVRLFNQLMPFMRNVKGYANLNTKSFNEMGQAARGKLIQQAMAQLDDMIDASKTSLDAMRGAASEAFKSILRFGGMAIFQRVKTIMGGIASAILDSEGNLTEFGKIAVVVGDKIGAALGPVFTWISDKFAAFTDHGNASTQEMIDKIVVMKDKFVELAKEIAKVTIELKLMTAAYTFVAGGGLGGPATIAGVKGIRNAQKLSPLQSLGVALSPSVVPAYAGPLTPAASAAAGAASETAAVGNAAMIAGLQALALILIPIGAAIFTVADNFSGLQPVLSALGAMLLVLLKPVGEMFKSLWLVAKPILLFIGLGVLGGLIAGLTAVFYVLKIMADIVNVVAEPLGRLFDYIYKKLQQWIFLANDPDAPGKRVGIDNSNPQWSLNAGAFQSVALPMSYPADDARKVSIEPPGKRPGTTVNQDFRNSRFNIDQKFAEGFDPDRVAIAFANDLAKVGDLRTNSQFASIFSR